MCVLFIEMYIAIYYAFFGVFVFVYLSHLQILTDLQAFQEKHLKADCEPFDIAVPKCYFSQYTSGIFPLTENVSIEPPESILVLEDMRQYGYKVWICVRFIYLCMRGCAWMWERVQSVGTKFISRFSH